MADTVTHVVCSVCWAAGAGRGHVQRSMLRPIGYIDSVSIVYCGPTVRPTHECRLHIIRSLATATCKI